MKIADDRLKLSITFGEYESRLIRQAAKIVMAMHGHPCLGEIRKDYRRIIMLAVLAYCRGVIKRGECPDTPVMADLRRETPAEYELRTKDKMPAFIANAGLTDQEIRYCELEGIEPADFLKAKSRQ
jgi:hypothetical protein